MNSLFLSNDEFSVKNEAELMSVTMRSSYSIMSPLTLTEKNRSSFSYTQKILNGKLHSTFSANNSKHGESPDKSRASISDQKKSSSNSKSYGSRSKSHRSISDEDEDFNEDSVISNNKYYQIFKDKNPIPKLLQQMQVHYRNTKPSKMFSRNMNLV